MLGAFYLTEPFRAMLVGEFRVRPKVSFVGRRDGFAMTLKWGKGERRGSVHQSQQEEGE